MSWIPFRAAARMNARRRVEVENGSIAPTASRSASASAGWRAERNRPRTPALSSVGHKRLRGPVAVRSFHLTTALAALIPNRGQEALDDHQSRTMTQDVVVTSPPSLLSLPIAVCAPAANRRPQDRSIGAGSRRVSTQPRLRDYPTLRFARLSRGKLSRHESGCADVQGRAAERPRARQPRSGARAGPDAP